jgi:hypothetical protein
MKKRIYSLIAAAFLLCAVPGFAFAGIYGSVYTAGVGRYLWRGRILDDGASVQPGISINANNFTFDWWGSCSAASKRLAESDYRVAFSNTVPYASAATFSSGFWSYTYPYFNANRAGSPSTTQEIFASVNLAVISAPTVSYYYDTFWQTKYLELAFSHAVELGDFGLNAGLSGGYEFKASSFSAAQGTLGLSYTVAGIKINPAYTGQIALGKEYKSVSTWSLNLNYDFELPVPKE